MQTEALSRLRYAAGRLRDCPSAAVRDIGSQMVAEIDAEIGRTPQLKPQPDLQEAELDQLLIEVERRIKRAGDDLAAEIARRISCIREGRRKPKSCSRCSKRARAKGLCLACYQRARLAALRENKIAS